MLIPLGSNSTNTTSLPGGVTITSSNPVYGTTILGNTLSSTSLIETNGYNHALMAVFMEHLAPHGWKLLNENEKNAFSDVALVCDACDSLLISQSFGLGMIGDTMLELMKQDAKERLEKHYQECKGADDVASES